MMKHDDYPIIQYLLMMIIIDYPLLSIYCPWDLGVSNFETLDKSGVLSCKVKLSRS